MDCYVLAPIKQFIDITIANLVPDTPEVQAEIEASIRAMLFEMAAPGQTIYAAWVSYAIMSAPSVQSFQLVTTADYVMPIARPHGGARHDPLRATVMSDHHIRRSGADYTEAFLSLLPQGQAWPKHAPGSVLSQDQSPACATIGASSTAAPPICSRRESDPRLTIELLPDWERNWGLPDPCYTAPLTIAERQFALVQRMTMQGAQSREFFIEVAASIGYTITISEYRVFVVGIDRCGDNRVYGDGSTPMFNEWNQPILNPARRAGGAKANCRTGRNYGLGPPEQSLLLDRACRPGEADLVSRHLRADAASIRICASALADDLECLLNRWKPAHTANHFRLLGPQQTRAIRWRGPVAEERVKYNQPYGIIRSERLLHQRQSDDRHDGLDPAGGVDRVSAARDRQR